MELEGTGVPLATPFDGAGRVDHESLAELVAWVEARGVDFLVPCGSTSEAPLLSDVERRAVVATVSEAATVPVVAGTGTPGLAPTLELTDAAAEAGADAALVVTPYYFVHDRGAVEAYYEAVADAAPVPVFLYSVPVYTGVALAPEAVGRLAAHPNVVGLKDSSGDLDAFQRTLDRVPDSFTTLVGAGGVYANALDAGADGGILALANVVPEIASGVYEAHESGDRALAHRLNDASRELNRAVTAVHGISGLKRAMRARGAPAGRARSPHRPVSDEVAVELEELSERALAALE